MTDEKPPPEICDADEVKHGTTTTVGHIKYYRDKFLGKGAFGSVYMGRSSGRDVVAVKRIEYNTKKEEETIGNEVKFLLKLESDNSKVVRYYTAVKSPEFYYIAMELGVCTVNDYVKKNEKFTGLRISSIDEVRILRDSSEGLEWLHKRQIIHRDIKPENILLVRDKKDGIVAKLADFGISKELTSGTQAMTSWKGTLDWMAPEVQESGGQVGSVGAADVFSLGLVFYYVLSKGKHPFSKNDTMTAKVIKSESACLDVVPKGSMRSLIEEMIQITPGDRPSSKYVARHPTFWEPKDMQLFYQAISDLINAKDENLKATVDKNPTRVFEEQGEQGEPKDWRTIIDKSLDEGSFKSYDATISELLRLVRNKLHHFKKIPAEGRRIVGDSKSGLVDYIADKFPLLLMHVWEAAVIRRDEPDIRDFYTAFSIIKVDPNTVILPAGVGTIEMAELRSSRETVERMSVSAADLPRLKGQLLEGLNHLNVRGPEVTEPRWPGWDEDDGLSVSLQGVTADTISHLADLGQTVGRLEIYDCPDLTAGSLETLTRCRELQRLSVTAADLPLLRGQLPEGLRSLNVRGPEVTEPRWPEWYEDDGLPVSLQGVAADTISHLAVLGRTVTRLEIYDFHDLTAGSLEPLTRCRGLRYLSVTAADLPLLSGQLPEGLSFLNVRGPEVTEPRWPELCLSLSVSLQGVAADTTSHLADLGRAVTRLEIYDCPDLTAGSLEPLTRCTELRYLSVTAADLPLLRGQLPEGLWCLNVRGPEVTEPRWPERYGSGLSVSLQGVAADTISHLATELGSRITLLVTDAQITTIPSQLRGAIIRVEPDTVILPAGVGDSELTELRSSRETVKRLSVSAADLPRLRERLPEGLECLNVRGPEVTEPRWPGWYGSGLSVSLQGVAADTTSHLATELGSRITLLVTDAQITTIPSQLRGAIIRVEPDTVILPAGVGDSELTKLRSSRETVKRLSVSAADLPRLRGQLPEGLKYFNVRGPEVTEPRWPGRYGSGLSVSLQGVAADTISHLATELGSRIALLVTDAQVTTIPSQLRGAIIRVGPNTIILPAGVGDSELTELQISRETVKRLSVTAADLPRLREQLPKGLRCLNVRGPEVTEPRWPEWYGSGLSVSLQGVAADTISHLAGLGRTVTVLDIYDCHDLTAGSLEPLTRCPGLRGLTLSGGVPATVSLEPLTRCPKLLSLTLSGGVPDAVLDSLSGCPGLGVLILGDRQRPAETAFTAAAYTRLVKSCRELCVLFLHCTADTGRAVLTALKEADLGRRSYGRPRTIGLWVPEELYDQLERQEGDGVDVLKWGK